MSDLFKEIETHSYPVRLIEYCGPNKEMRLQITGERIQIKGTNLSLAILFV
jgi:hypothetical protein